MKKLFSKLMLVAMAATTFIACEDVPEPYGKPYEKGNNTEIEGAKGTGTKDDPFNAIAALNYGNGLASGEVSGDYYYIKGKVVSVKEEFTTNFGNGTFYISEDGTSTNQFYVYRVLYLGNKKFADGDKQIAVGDDVVICSKITNYNGTIETQQKEGFVYELNGENRGGEPSGGGEPAGDPTGEGTLENPYNAAAAIAYCKQVGDAESDKEVYIKGKVVAITEQYGTLYGNATFTISDDGTDATTPFTVFRALYLGNKKYTSGDLLNEKDEVIICGKVTCFMGNTPETVQGKAYLYSLNGNSEGGGEGGGGGQGGGGGEAAETGTNGNFESWTGDVPDNWKTASTAGNATLSKSTDAHGGSYSVKVGGASQNKRIGYKEMQFKAGSYTMKFFVKAATAEGGSVRPGFVAVNDGVADSSGYKYGDYVNDLTNTTWVEVTHTFDIPADGTYSIVIMNSKNPGKDVLIDDFTLTSGSTTIIK